MLSCGEIENLLSAYYDGELGVAASAQVERHLCECEVCKKKLGDIKYISSLLLRREVLEVDEVFKKSLREKLSDEKKKNGRKNAFFSTKNMKVCASLAACFIIFIGVYAVVERGYFSAKHPSVILSDYEEKTRETTYYETEKNVSKDDLKDDIENTSLSAASNEEIKNNVGTGERTAENKAANVSVAETNKPALTQPQDEETVVNEKNIVQAEITNEPSSASIQQDIQPVLPACESLNKSENRDCEETTVDDEQDSKTDFADDEIRKSTAYFKLSDHSIKESVIDLLKQYGEPVIDEGAIMIEVLGANYDSCISALSEIAGVDKYTIDRYEGSKYCYIRIEI